MLLYRSFLAITTLLAILTHAQAQTIYPAPVHETPEYWYGAGHHALQRALKHENNTGSARNIILFVGDGMGLSTVTAARIFAAQQQNRSGEENLLSFEKFPATGLVKTYNTNQQTSDSAGTATAIMSGIKTRAGVIGVNQLADRGDCKQSLGTEVPSLMQQASARGMSTGFVTTTQVTHATPAATYAHSPEREWESDAAMPAEALAAGCKDIAAQLLDFNSGKGPNVAMGGGLSLFIPETEADPLTQSPGVRRDGRNLIREWTQRDGARRFVWTRDQLASVDLKRTTHLLGLFNRSHMSFAYDRQSPDSHEPGLADMTRAAIELLHHQSGDKGFFLMVEAGRIDHAHHAGNAYRALHDTVELSLAVEAALEAVNPEETLIIVTADHSHSLTLGGYATRGNDILGTVVGNDPHGHSTARPNLADDGLPYTALGYRDGPGFAVDMGGTKRHQAPGAAGRHDLTDVNTRHPDFHQEALVPLASEGHTGEDVAIYATGPWAHLFQGVQEQNYIYHVMRHALGW